MLSLTKTVRSVVILRVQLIEHYRMSCIVAEHHRGPRLSSKAGPRIWEAR
jgi:hypothetical protein